ncbi:MAG: DUF4382 domain-containing protein [Halobacterium sp.]
MSRTAVTLAVTALLVTAGCSGLMPGAGDGEGGAGTVAFYVSDQPGAIEDFDHLNVTITQVAFHPANASENESWVTRDVDNRTVDLTRLQGDNASIVGNHTIPAGDYDKVFIHVGAINATLTSGESADVKLPSEKLQLSSNFTVEANETLSFVYDVRVHRTGSGMYILRPQAGESGPDKPITRVDQRRGGEGGGPGGQGGGQGGGQNATTAA